MSVTQIDIKIFLNPFVRMFHRAIWFVGKQPYGVGIKIFLLCAAVCLQITFMDLALYPLKIQKCNPHQDVCHDLPVIPDY